MLIHSLNTYPNQFYESVGIPNYSLLEIYKDEVAESNRLGYCILPIQGLDDLQIEEAIRTKVENSKPAGYTTLHILAGRTEASYNRRRVYCVWSESTPSYPAATPVNVAPPSLTKFNEFNVTTINYKGSGTTPVTVKASITYGETVIKVGDATIQIKENVSGELEINQGGAFLNGQPLSSFTITSTPVLHSGVNYIKASKNISKLNILYTEKY